ncbi:MAG: site-specific integrase, partial [Clostridium sp.]|nr:site-specific integrase [Clostridium sp.]
MVKRRKSKTKVKNGIEYYYKRIELGRDPLTGKRIQKEFYAKSVAQLNEKVQKYTSLSSQKINPDNKETFGEFMGFWLKECKFKSGIKNSTKERYWGLYKNYISNIKSFLKLNLISESDIKKLFICNIRITNINTICIQQYYNTLQKIGVSENTIKSLHILIKPCLSYAYANDKTIKDYGTSLVTPKTFKSVKKNDVEVFTLDEQKCFLNTIVGNREEVLYHVAISMGLRLGELLALTWSCIDFDNGTIKIEKSVRREKNFDTGESFLTLTSPKTNSSYAIMFMPKFLIPELKAHKSKQNAEKLLASNIYVDNDLVFCTPTGKIIEPTNLRKRFKKLLSKSGIVDKKFHSLRHT